MYILEITHLTGVETGESNIQSTYSSSNMQRLSSWQQKGQFFLQTLGSHGVHDRHLAAGIRTVYSIFNLLSVGKLNNEHSSCFAYVFATKHANAKIMGASMRHHIRKFASQLEC